MGSAGWWRRFWPAVMMMAAAPAGASTVQTGAAALAQDAAAYAADHGVTIAEAERRLRAQEETVALTDAIGDEYADRLAGIAIEHDPWRIVVLLTGDVAVPERLVTAGGMIVPVVFRTGAPATRAALLAALTDAQARIRASLLKPPGLGVDPRTGTLVAMVSAADVDREGAVPLAARLTALAGVPVRLRAVERASLDMAAPVAEAVEGGGRVVGPVDGRMYACTTGFAVTDGVRTGIVTAAHCPDTLDYVDPAAGRAALDFLGQWGWGYQDVQLHVAAVPVTPLFYADTARSLARPVTARRARASTRAGDVVCHRGERTGYSCATVELTDFAPAGDLCGGPCLPTWVTVTGPRCQGGDSGAPVFLGTTAFGIVKGGTYRSDRSCAFYFYMSSDYLPAGWRLLGAP